MREIKFRAWDKVNNKWLTDIDKELIINPITTGKGQFQLDEYNSIHHNPVGLGTTVELMQFTGLHDKNGKEIWESDILCVTSSVWCCTNELLVVVWLGTGYWGLKREDGTQFHTSLVGVMGSAKFEVIGNIHENPKLLKEPPNA